MDMDAFMSTLSYAPGDPENPTNVITRHFNDDSIAGGFGPGPYTGGYTGVEAGGGLTGIYWGSFDDDHIAAIDPVVHIGPGGLVQQAIGADGRNSGIIQQIVDADGSSTGGTILLPRSETTSVTAVDPMITPGETIATPGGTEMIQLGGTKSAGGRAPTDYGTDVFSRTGGKPGIAAGGHSEAISDVVRGGGVRADREAAADVEMQNLGGIDDEKLSEAPGAIGEEAPARGVVASETATDVTMRGGTTVDSGTIQTGTEGTMGGGPGGSTEMIQLGGGRGGTPGGFAEIGGQGGGFLDAPPDPWADWGSSAWGQSDAINVQVLPDVPGGGTDTAGGGDVEMNRVGARPTGTWDTAGETVALFDTKTNGAPMLLDDIPGPTPDGVMSWDVMDLGKVDPEMKSVLSAAFEEEGNSSLGIDGIGSDLGGFGGFMKSRMYDIVGGAILTPFFGWLDDKTKNPWASRMIQGSLAAYGLVAGGDPFGVIAAPIVWGIQEFMKQRQRLLANDDPESERGKKFAYVREGDKWYPAIQTYKERDEGWIGSDKTQVKFQYGNEIKWRKGKMGDWMPYFEPGQYKLKNFHVSDSETDNTETGKAEAGIEWQRRVDPLRDFYYLSEKETIDYLTGVAGGEAALNTEHGHEWTQEEKDSIQQAQKDAFSSFMPKDDEGWTDYWTRTSPKEAAVYNLRGEYVDQLQDIRKSLEFLHSYRYSDEGSLSATDFGMDEFEGSRKFRKTVNENNYLGLSKGGAGQNEDDLYFRDLSGRLEGVNAAELAESGKTRFQNSKEMRHLTDMFIDAKDLLYKTQKAAGTKMGFIEKYSKAATPDYHPVYYTDPENAYYHGSLTKRMTGEGNLYYSFQPNAYRGLEKNAWALYQDGTWELGKLNTAEDLRAAIAKIDASGHSEWVGTQHYRNSDQRAYLAQKAYTRYLFGKINHLGGYDYTFGGSKHGTTVKRTTVWSPYEYRDQDSRRPGSVAAYDENADINDLKFVNRWALDPMYSEIDDHNSYIRTFGTGGIIHRDGHEDRWDDTQLGQQDDNYLNLVQAGVIDAGENNPDYIAGNFSSLEEFNLATGGDDIDEPWDEGTRQNVPWGYQTPGSTYNPETDTFDMPDDWIDPNPYVPPEDPAFEASGDDAFSQFLGGWHGEHTDDWDEPPVGYLNKDGFMLPIPTGWFIDEFGNLVEREHEPTEAELKAEQDAQDAADKAAQDAEDKAAQDAADEKAAQEQAAQDEKAAQEQAAKDAQDAAAASSHVEVDPSGGGLHDDYTPPVHVIQHFAADATAPGHIPMGLIAQQIQEGVKVI